MLIEVVDQYGHTLLVSAAHIEMIDLITNEIVLMSGIRIVTNKDDLERVLGVVGHES